MLASPSTAKESDVRIEILGKEGSEGGQLDQNTRQALALLEITTDINYVTDDDDIREYGVSDTPCLVVDGQVLLEGQAASPIEIKTRIVASGLGT